MAEKIKRQISKAYTKIQQNINTYKIKTNKRKLEETSVNPKAQYTSSTHRRHGSFASSRTPFIKDLNPFSGDIR